MSCSRFLTARWLNGLESNTRRQVGRQQIRASLLTIALLLGCGDLLAPDPVRADALGDFTATGEDDALAALVGLYINHPEEKPLADLAILQTLATKGNLRAQTLLGGLNLAQLADQATAGAGLAQLVQAAAKGSADAAAMLAFHFLYSSPGQDYDKARHFAQQAADGNVKEGYYVLATMSAYGWGGQKDPAAAAKQMRKAADLGDAHALHQLAQYYHSGFGVDQNDVAAYAAAMLAATRGEKLPEAIKLQDSLALLLLPDEVLQGQHLAHSWKPGDDLAARVTAERDAPDVLPATGGAIVSATGPVYGDAEKRAALSDIGVVERLYTDDAVVQADGTVTSTWHVELEARNEAAVKSLGQIPIRYDNATEEIDILDAHTLKADGRKIAVDPATILTEQAPDSQDDMMFDDRRRKVLIFPNVEVGDMVAYTVRHKLQPLIPGVLSTGTYFDPRDHEADVRFSLTAPKSMPIFIETHGLPIDQSTNGDTVTYRLTYANRRPLAEIYSDFNMLDSVPRNSVTNLHDYQQFVGAYYPMVAPKLAITPQIQALADKLTSGMSDRRDQAKAIYEWVSRHIRYVGVEYGVGSIVPHEADKILTNGYGDCKDHSAIFAALLKAKGIKADLVLINSGWRMSMNIFPRISNFDHMITYLPEFDLYADTTAEVAPFGVLPFAEYGKPVVHVPLDKADLTAPAVHRVPVLKPEAATITMKTTAHLQSDGKIVGDSETVATGPFSVDVRNAALDIQSDGQAKKAIKWLKDDGYDGTGSFDFSPPHDLAPSYRLAGHFETDAYDGLLNGSQFALPRGLVDGWGPGAWLMGSITFKGKKDDPTYCWSGHEIEELSLELPSGTHLAKLPAGRKVENEVMSFHSIWSMTGQTVMVRREFISKIETPVCLGWARDEMAAALPRIRNDLDTRISLTTN